MKTVIVKSHQIVKFEEKNVYLVDWSRDNIKDDFFLQKIAILL